MTICILGAGAFGTALAIALSGNEKVQLWGRNEKSTRTIKETRKNSKLPGHELGPNVSVTSDLNEALQGSSLVLCAVPLQNTHQVLQNISRYLEGQALIGCSKGIDLDSGLGGYSILKSLYPDGPVGILTGPSFAVDIAKGLPTALTLASNENDDLGEWQIKLSNGTLRIYISHDPIGAEIGGALKNVIAIACGAAVGAGLGESARAALITRGHAEIIRYAMRLGAQAETLAGLSGFGDLCLTCTSNKSRNYCYGMELSGTKGLDPSRTIEGKATALAMVPILKRLDIEMPITEAVAKLCSGTANVSEVMADIMARPLKKEIQCV
ncbi:MAG: NAD(P)-dependent glycerol-3-phosphate dehydrogenase [Planktomarina sp.]|jgi:glycerol-3-phosphate dehydrogenase (NAD(P)+)|nr:NAD(P)-dependent glycerol-3-phosphate dehydrogenase [Planktomarina sp.]|tara:strand:- start:520 stop:1494 length:975 start_codon:yes stop_codon:yes gene_type:complete